MSNSPALFDDLNAIIADSPVERPESFIYGRDCDVLPILFRVYAPGAVDVLDCTFNQGTMWEGAGRFPTVTMDIDPRHKTDVVGDFMAMPFPDASFDVIIFDPPHLGTNGVTVNSSKIWEKRYGITDTGAGREGPSVEKLFAPFLVEAKRVLRQDGVVLAKLADIITSGQKRWHSVDFINAVRAEGLTPCDVVIKADPAAGNMKSSKWKTVRHVKNAHVYWFIVRKGKCTLGDAA